MIGIIYAIIPGILIMLITILIMYRRKKPASRIVLTAVFILYITGVICLTFFPVDYTDVVDENFDVFNNTIKLIPFEIITGMIQKYDLFVFMVEVGGNILMTIPFGLMLPLLIPEKKKVFYPLMFFAFTFGIESMQLLIGFLLGTFYRTADVDDIILNFTGAMIGFLIFRFLPVKLKEKFI